MKKSEAAEENDETDVSNVSDDNAGDDGTALNRKLHVERGRKRGSGAYTHSSRGRNTKTQSRRGKSVINETKKAGLGTKNELQCKFLVLFSENR